MVKPETFVLAVCKGVNFQWAYPKDGNLRPKEENMDIVGWIFNVVSLLILIVTIYYLHRSIDLTRRQIELAREERKTYHRDNWHSIWNKFDEILIEHPEFSDLWIYPDSLESIKKRMSSEKELNNFLKRRAFASYTMGLFFRDFMLKKEVQEFMGGEEIENVSLSPELIKMWDEGAIREEFDAFPEFIEFIEKKWFCKLKNSNNSKDVENEKTRTVCRCGEGGEKTDRSSG